MLKGKIYLLVVRAESSPEILQSPTKPANFLEHMMINYTLNSFIFYNP